MELMKIKPSCVALLLLSIQKNKPSQEMRNRCLRAVLHQQVRCWPWVYETALYIPVEVLVKFPWP